jgi:excinuclease ABC subunit A
VRVIAIIHEVQKVKWNGYSIVDILNLDINEALPVFKKEPKIERDLLLLKEVGLGYLHLGESTPTLSGGEAQRLKLVTHLSHKQDDTLFVFDEPTIGLHPLGCEGFSSSDAEIARSRGNYYYDYARSKYDS